MIFPKEEEEKRIAVLIVYAALSSLLLEERTLVWVRHRGHSTEKQSLHSQFHMSDGRKFLQNNFWLLTFRAEFPFTFCTLSVLGDIQHSHVTTIQTSGHGELSGVLGSRLLHPVGWR